MTNCYIKPGIPCSSYHDATVKKRFNFIKDNLEITKDMLILDVGTGFGAYIFQLSHQAKLYVGIDINKESIQKATNIKNLKNTELMPMSVENLAFKNNSFDAVLLIEVIEHVVNDDKAINEISRILKPCGKLIITAPNKLFPFETHGFRIKSKIYGSRGLGFPLLPYLPEFLRIHVANAKVYTPWQLKKKLIRNGFSIKNTAYLSPGLDQLKMYFPKLSGLINKTQIILNSMEKIYIINNFLTTCIICAEKRLDEK